MSIHKPWIANSLNLLLRIRKSFLWRIANPGSRRWGHLQALLKRDELDDISFKCYEDILRLGEKGSGPHRKCLDHFNGSIKIDITSSKAAQKYMNISISNWIKLEYDKQRKHISLNKQMAWEIEEYNMHKPTYILFDIIGHIELTAEEKIIVQWKMDLIEDMDAMEQLECSERTLYNRWNKLREKLLTVIG
tara:strand:- start:29 stop:601 length:573 start_codon:yes stop_codon:yes gene_type:complete